jgi:hypothetical protein
MLGLLAATSTQALWLATADMSYYSNAGEAVWESPFCQVGRGDTREQAISQATRQVGAVAIAGIRSCSELPYVHSNQLGGFWDDYGTINYEDGNWHWYCNTGTGGACDAGNGAPKK